MRGAPSWQTSKQPWLASYGKFFCRHQGWLLDARAAGNPEGVFVGPGILVALVAWLDDTG